MNKIVKWSLPLKKIRNNDPTIKNNFTVKAYKGTCYLNCIYLGGEQAIQWKDNWVK